MLSDSIIQQTALGSHLGAQSILAPKGARWKRGLAADLLLTALIDAFSILVIFLLMNFSSTGEILYVSKNIELPKASQVDLLDRNPVIKLDQDKIFMEDKEVTADTLVSSLLDLRKQFTDSHPGQEFPAIATIQADRHAQYSVLNQVVLALSHAGFSDIHFAVLTK